MVKAGRSSRGHQFRANKPPKTLAQRPPRPKQHADTDEAYGQARVHLQPAGNRSFARAPLTVALNASSCATCANFASRLFFLRLTLLTDADLSNVFLPAFRRRSAESLLAWPTWSLIALPRIRRPRREGACTISPDSRQRAQ